MTELLIHWQHRREFGQANWPTDLERSTIRLGLNWRRDLNHALPIAERSFDDHSREFVHRAPLIEHAHRAVTLIPTTTKPFDVLAEGLLSKNSRGDWMAIELFLEPLKWWPDNLILAGKQLLVNCSAESARP